MRASHWYWEFIIQLLRYCKPHLALTLLVARVGANHHDPPVATDHPALVADGLDARVHLHGGRSCLGCSATGAGPGRGL